MTYNNLSQDKIKEIQINLKSRFDFDEAIEFFKFVTIQIDKKYKLTNV